MSALSLVMFGKVPIVICMINILRRNKPFEQEARAIYSALLLHIRQPVFYTDYGVADKMEARFDLLVLHVYLVMRRLLAEAEFDAQSFNQRLFDIMFADMDQTLRESGIGDMGVPKRMKTMMIGFNGRSHVYEDALAQADDAALAAALEKNIGIADKLIAYVRTQDQYLSDLSLGALLNAEFEFKV